MLAISRGSERSPAAARDVRSRRSLSRTARRLGTHVGGHDLEQLSKVWPLAAIAGPMLGGAAASLWLAPLDGDEYRAERAALSAWLQRHGSWDRAARDLDLHRNTVRRLVASRSTASGSTRDLDDPVERARLLLAFTAIDPGTECSAASGHRGHEFVYDVARGDRRDLRVVVGGRNLYDICANDVEVCEAAQNPQ